MRWSEQPKMGDSLHVLALLALMVTLMILFVEADVNSQSTTDGPVSYRHIKGVIQQQECHKDGCHDYLDSLECTDADPVHDEQNLCPYPPPGLGPLTANFSMNTRIHLTPEVIESWYPDVHPGGHWSPKNCRARQKVAVIVPYRDREEDRLFFLPNLHGFLQKQLLEYTIFLIEQGDGKHFNRGSLFNVGVQELLEESFGCFIIHDIDKYPENTRNLYMCSQEPKHLYVKSRLFNNLYSERPYDYFFGGVVAILKEHFVMVNGFSNMFWGWGNEDDNFRDRLLRHKLQPSRVPADIGVYREVKSKPLGFVSVTRHQVMKEAAAFYDTDGLSDLQYRKLSETKHPLYTGIKVELTAPDPYEKEPL